MMVAEFLVEDDLLSSFEKTEAMTFFMELDVLYPFRE
jgi:hypothetical protein